MMEKAKMEESFWRVINKLNKFLKEKARLDRLKEKDL